MKNYKREPQTKTNHNEQPQTYKIKQSKQTHINTTQHTSMAESTTTTPRQHQHNASTHTQHKITKKRKKKKIQNQANKSNTIKLQHNIQT